MEQTFTRLYESDRLIHDRLDNNIHVFTFHESSRNALDDWFGQIRTLWIEYPQHNTPVPMLVDSSTCGTQPLGYAYQKARKLYAEYDYRPIFKMAFMERNLIMVRALDAFLYRLHGSPWTRYFTPAQRDDALTWLLSK
jgi:hypothetical protein